MMVFFSTAHALAKHDKSFMDFTWMCDLIAKVLRILQVDFDIGHTYRTDRSAALFVKHISQVETANTAGHIGKSKFVSFTIDGSTDLTGEELESICVRYVNDGKIIDKFLHVGSPNSGSSSDIYDYLEHTFSDVCPDINGRKIVGICTDGASNMTGRISGLCTLFKNRHNDEIVSIHCLCHRLELAFKDSMKKYAVFQKMNTLLLGLYYLYKKSPKQKKMLEKAFESHGKRVNSPRRVGGTRWVSHLYEAINIFIGSYPVFMDELDTASHINPKAEGLAKLGRSLNVLHFILILREFIVPLKRLSLSLQKRDQALSDTIVTIKAMMDVLPIMLDDINQDAANVLETKMYKGVTLTQKGQPPSPELRRGVADTLLACIEKRFPDISDNDVLKATGLTMLSSWPLESQMRGFGELHVRNAYQHFRESLLHAGVQGSEGEIITEFRLMRSALYHLYGDSLQKTTWPEVHTHLSRQEGYDNILILSDLLRTLPPTSVANEVLFSHLKLMKTQRRGRLGNKALNDQLVVKLSTGDIGSFDASSAIKSWEVTPSGQAKRYNYTRRPASLRAEVCPMIMPISIANTLELLQSCINLKPLIKNYVQSIYFLTLFKIDSYWCIIRDHSVYQYGQGSTN